MLEKKRETRILNETELKTANTRKRKKH